MSLYIETIGRGDDVVLIHGWGINGAVWNRVAEALAHNHCVHIVDLPGHGLSAPVEPYSLPQMAAAFDEAFPLPVHVVGWSLGGAVAVEWALAQPDKIRSLTLTASSPCFMQREDWPEGTPADVLDKFANGLADNFQMTIKMFLGLQVLGSAHARPVLRELEKRVFSRGEPQREALMAGLEVIRDTDLRPHAAKLECPLLLQYGERDGMTSLSAGHWYAHHAGGRLVVHLGGGHAPFISHEADFVAELKAFLADN
ncbi:pimeloyl-ACP methyl ester esterase BioH [Parachitinimonas caeni]|uniref:Pimeloyl-[acyl-carrier protein] methyl ester esterase n=1 Tax=Parachitinimonas caeni TaxID=3031301 RepID=A0ABT7DUL1_9NEIS|nr:pimeloyl-ACP methyl ester esterase BioH [Parachitinimonas caeni]MDK2123754.1 pimeloyl-ACP methyl ester esterase BioH [Parachitinimonas caeni]